MNVPADVHLVDWPTPGRLAVMPRPPGGAALAAALKSLRDLGVDTLVSALTTSDRSALQLVDEPGLAVAAGMSYISFPIADFGVPDRDALVDLADELSAEIRSGRFVTVHCLAGVGRSGLIACSVLIDLGASAQEAMEVVSRARGYDSPETDEQRARSEEHTSELQSRENLVCRLLLEKKKKFVFHVLHQIAKLMQTSAAS